MAGKEKRSHSAASKRKTTKPKSKSRRSRSNSSERQKPIFPVKEIHLMLSAGRSLKTVDPQVPVFLNAVEEYVTHELLELASNHARSRGSGVIDKEDILAAVRDDRELNQLLGEAVDA